MIGSAVQLRLGKYFRLLEMEAKRKISNSQFLFILVLVALLQFAGMRFCNHHFIFGFCGIISFFLTISFFLVATAFYLKNKSWRFFRHLFLAFSILAASRTSLKLDLDVKLHPDFYCDWVIKKAEDHKLQYGRYPSHNFMWLYMKTIKMEYYLVNNELHFELDHDGSGFAFDPIGRFYSSESGHWH